MPPQTGGWLDALQVHRAAATKFPAEAPHLTAPSDVMAAAERLISRLETVSLPEYFSAGTLAFIDWSNPPILETDSLTLTLEREFSLAAKFAELRLAEIAQDHSASGGYTTGACGAATV